MHDVMRKRWRSSDPIVVRQVWQGRIWAAFPVTIVEDSPQRMTIYIAPATTFMAPDCTREDHVHVLASRQWRLVEYTWNAQPMLWTTVPGEACSVWTMWRAPGWEHIGWKVNPEAPWQRTPFGFDTTDHVLDAGIRPDFTWDWKDENEFADAVAFGLFTATDAEKIRGAASWVIHSLLGTKRAKAKAWATWRPPQTWHLPRLPQGWDAML